MSSLTMGPGVSPSVKSDKIGMFTLCPSHFYCVQNGMVTRIMKVNDKWKFAFHEDEKISTVPVILFCTLVTF